MTFIRFYTELPGEEYTYSYSTGSSIRDEEIESEKRGEHGEDKSLPEAGEIIEELRSLFRNMVRGAGTKETDSTAGLLEIAHEIVDDSEWNNTWMKSFEPVWIDEDMVVKPVWTDEESVLEGADATSCIVIDIEPGIAFGTGGHETTKLCLEGIRKCIFGGGAVSQAKKPGDTNLLDIGCGSGILSIAALKLGIKHCVSIDVDKLAVEDTVKNMEINSIASGTYEAICMDMLKDVSPLMDTGIKAYDIIVANILADVIIPLCDRVKDFLSQGGYFISSGILAEKSDEVREALARAGYKIISENTMGEWVSYIAVRP